MSSWWISLAMALCARLGTARADPRPTRAHPTVVWLFPQLVPSPLVIFSRGVSFGMQWQVTPILYAWGVRREVDPWRSLVVEPLVRQGGSVELHVGPEYLPREARQSPWAWRTGLRAYVPLAQHGDNLSLSVGVSYLYQSPSREVWFSLGAQVLYGTLGVEVSYSLSDLESLIFALRFRYF